MRCLDHSITHTVLRGVGVGTCRNCRWVRFGDAAAEGDAWESMSVLFGEYELVGRVDAVLAPGPEVLAYRARRAADRSVLRVTPPHRWFNVNEHLWMCHDGSLLLLAHGWPSVSRAVGA